jgi:phosphohistidine phosphatase
VRRLLLFRHAKATRSGRGIEDRPRALIERGRKDSATIGAYIAEDALIPDRVLVSPAVRTQETWKFSGPEFRTAVDVETIEELYDATAEAILAVLKGTPVSVHNLLVIAHNPGLHELALMLIGSGSVNARARLMEKLPTAGLVVIDFAIDDWSELRRDSGRLDRYITPKHLKTGGGR